MFVALALLIAGAVVLSHTAPAPFILEAFRPSKSVWRMPSTPDSPPRIYLTFDDGPNPEWTPAVLDALRDEEIQATFFLIDEHITPESEPIVKRIAAEGHAIGLHTGKRWLLIHEPDALAKRLTAAAARIKAIAGVEPCRLFRPHGGWRSASMYDALAKIDYRLAGWSWGMWDWHPLYKRDPERTAKRLARKASGGDIVVIHDGHHIDPRADRSHTPKTIRLMVPPLKTRGFSFGRLCDPPSQ